MRSVNFLTHFYGKSIEYFDFIADFGENLIKSIKLFAFQNSMNRKFIAFLVGNCNCDQFCFHVTPYLSQQCIFDIPT